MSYPFNQAEVWELRNRIWDYAPDPIALAAGEVDGPSQDEAAQLVAADIQAEIQRGEPVSDFLRRWAEQVKP